MRSAGNPARMGYDVRTTVPDVCQVKPSQTFPQE